MRPAAGACGRAPGQTIIIAFPAMFWHYPGGRCNFSRCVNLRIAVRPWVDTAPTGDEEMGAKWVAIVLALAGICVVLWASDKITYEGERTVYTVRCEQGEWQDLRCNGKMVAAERYRFRASTVKQEVLYWVVGSPAPSGKFSQCKVKDRGNWSCPENAGQPPTIAHEMVNGRPTRSAGDHDLPFRAVPKWVWWVLDAGVHVYHRAGY